MRSKSAIIFLSIILLSLLAIPLVQMIAGASTRYQIHILEINDNGKFPLQEKLQNSSNFTVTTMRMKQFVAMREELDGKYDAIYIGGGTYNTTGVQGQDHNTTGIMNDITELKARDIIDNYIEKGLPVILNKALLNQPATSKNAHLLYDYFSPYQDTTARPFNVFFIADEELAPLAVQMEDTNSSLYKIMTQRPQLSVSNKPADYETAAGQSVVYRQGQELRFDFNVGNVSGLAEGNVEANLYLGIDKVLKMGSDQLVATEQLNSTQGTLSYKLPKAYSGLLYWKLEIVNRQSGTALKNYTTGVIRYQDEKTVVRVLQVLPSDGKSSGNSSLLNSANMKPSYLAGTDYQLDITVKTFEEFNSTVYRNLNGTYDMIVLGFRDQYNQFAPLNDASAAAIRKFIASGQGVMFTHDTVFDKNNAASQIWLKYFQTDSGQIAPKTNIGLNAPNKSRTTAVVNKGLLTEYPFDLSQPPSNSNGYIGQINQTHDQYFTLDLEDPEVVSWYNITGSNRDVQDSWNHYYTYSKGNVTYSGTGHTNTGFPEWEQKLFVNTMYRAFIGSNHAPEITVTAPADGSTKPSYLKNFVLSYTANDWDLKDRNLTASVKFKHNGKVLTDLSIPEKTVLSGQAINETFENPLPEGGTLQIEITVKDKQGALATKTVNFTIERAEANLLTNREIISGVQNGEAEQNTPLTIEYSVTPKPVSYQSVNPEEQASSKLVISNIQYKEQLPPQLEITGTLPEGMTKEGTAATGYVLTMPLPDIQYRLSGQSGVQSYVPVMPEDQPAVKFRLTLTPVGKGAYNLVNAQLNYADIHSATRNIAALGNLKDYSVLILGDITMDRSGFSTAGRVAGAGNVNLPGGFSIGTELGDNAKGTPVLIAGKNLTVSSGSVYKGKAVYGDTISKPEYTDYTAVQGTPIDFDAMGTKLRSMSNDLAALPAKGSVTKSYSTLTLTGTDPELNIFQVADSQLGDGTNSIVIDAPASSHVLVNVSGSHVKISGGLTVNGPTYQHILYNFNQASSLQLNNIGVLGSVLAPNAALNFGGSIKGSLIGASMTGTGYGSSSIPFYDVDVEGLAPAPDEKDRVTIVFPDIIFNSVVKVKTLYLEDISMLVGDQKTLIPTVSPVDANNKVLNWSSANPKMVTVTPSGENGTIQALAPGKTFIEIRSTDGSNITYRAAVTVIQPGLSIQGPAAIGVAQVGTLQAILNPSDEKARVTWSVKDSSSGTSAKPVLTVNTANPWQASITGQQPGKYTVVATVTTANGRTYTAEHTLWIFNIRIDGPSAMNDGEKITLTAVTDPAGVTPAPAFTWSLGPASTDSSNNAGSPGSSGGADSAAHPGSAELSSSTGSSVTLTGKEPGKVNVIVSSGGMQAAIEVIIHPVLRELILQGPIRMNVGNTVDLMDNSISGFDYRPRSVDISTLLDHLAWSMPADQTSIRFEHSGSTGQEPIIRGGSVIQAIRPGYTTVTLSYTGKPDVKPVTIGIIVLSGTTNPDNPTDNNDPNINGDRY
ncbi:DUF5057 domain-containing protein [Paenibacillus wulumuqiensis]|uniref:DUF5057 domain-containing protein n=1 Tax=Paenibacillus wulumuqiensis TaxID=1567107 RepID=UPI000697B393|nr:DUF5057 domain-containing protein [Paenibacillus wulumuqiensis]